MKRRELYLINAYVRTHPDAAARELERQPPGVAADLLQRLPLKQTQRLVEQMIPNLAARLLQAVPNAFAVDLLSKADARKAVAILRCLSRKMRDSILENLPERRALVIRFLLTYPDDTVGAWMIADTLMLPSTILADDALNRLRRSESDLDSDAIPIVNEAGRPIGVTGARRLLNASGDTPLRQLVTRPCPTLPGRLHLATALSHSLWEQHSTLVVLDRYQVAVGVIRQIDLRYALAQTQPHRPPSQPASSHALSDVGGLYIESLVALLDLLASTKAATTRSIQ